MTTDSDTQHLVRGSLLAKLGLSVRGIVILVIVLTVCAMNLTNIAVVEPLYSLVIVTVGYYFGQQHNTEKKP